MRPGLDSRFIDWKHSARHRKLLCKEFRTERNHQIVMAFDTGYLMLEPVDGITRLDHAINAGLMLAWVSLQGGDLVGTYGFDAAVRQYLAADPRACRASPASSAPPPSSTTITRRPISRSVWPSSMLGSSGARWSSCSPISSTPSRPSC